MILQRFRLDLTLATVALYLLLEGAFMQLRIPPGSINAVPVGELLLVFCLATAVLDTRLVGPFLRSVPVAPLMIWWTVGGVQLALGFFDHGFWAMRDATSLVESLFLWVGFAAADVSGAIPKIIKWYWRILALAVVIALTYPFRNFILSISPVILSAQQKEIPLFFTYQLTPITALTAGFALLVSDLRVGSIRLSWLGGALFVFVAALFQARTIYLQILFLFALLALTQPARLSRLLIPMAAAVLLFVLAVAVGIPIPGRLSGIPMAAAVLLFVLAVAVGIPIPGRLSGNVSLSFYLEHFLAIGGDSSAAATQDDAIRGAAGGVGQRMNWWAAIWEGLTSSWQRALFGLGYGISLVGLANDPYIDPAVREPHNSLMSAFGRTGIVGLLALVALQATLALRLLQTYRAYAARGMNITSRFIYVMGAMFGMFWIAAMGEDAFEKPFVAIPYYFYFGVILNLWYRDRFGEPARATNAN